MQHLINACSDILQLHCGG